VEQGILHRELRGFMHDQSGRAFRSAAHMEMRDMHFVARREVFEDIVVPRQDGVVDIILR
jgi:hypothetical protein